MVLSGQFTMISLESRESNGKMYHSVNIEAEDGKLLRLGVDEKVIPDLHKYQKHQGWFDVGSYKGEMYMRLIDATVIDSPQSAK